jgi:hypothetical protein
MEIVNPPTLSQASVKIVIDNEERQIKLNNSILFIQKFVRKRFHKKRYSRFKKAITRVMECPDTVRITPAKFVQPLYLAQRPLIKKICGDRAWIFFQRFVEGYGLLALIPIYLFASMVSFLYLFNYYYNIKINLLAIFLIMPFYLLFFLIFQDQLLILALSSLECKTYLFFALLSCILLSDLFRDNRILNVWLVSFPGLFLIPLADAIPRYLKKCRMIFNFYLFLSIMYNTSLIFGLRFGYIDIHDRQYIINSAVQNNNTVSFSTMTYTSSFLEGLTMLTIKNLVWYLLNGHRGIIVKSPVLITSVKAWSMPEKNYQKKKSIFKKKKNFIVKSKKESFLLNKTKNDCYSHTEIQLPEGNKINRIHLKPQFALFHCT